VQRHYNTGSGVFLIDLEGWAMWHVKHLDKVKALVDIVQSQYPERLERALLVNVPFIFMGAWKM
jgi:hypothetical protein